MFASSAACTNTARLLASTFVQRRITRMHLGKSIRQINSDDCLCVACMCAVHQHNGWAAIGGFGLGHLDVKGMHKLQGCTDGSSVLSIPWLGH